jgi:steroid 5-alpha reductase family enzyme
MLLHLGTVVFILGKLTTDYSWVDRIWSLLPLVITAHLMFYQVHCLDVAISHRQVIMMAFITVWGVRLTYNLYRKGGYAGGGEDYRWVYIRKSYPKMLVEMLHFFFTSYYQLFLVYWITSPIFYASH